MPFRVLKALALTLTVSAAAAVAAYAADANSDDVLHVTLDQAKLEKAPAGATTLIIGNPAIADVTLTRGGSIMILTGKSYGQTNFIALDEQGNVVSEKQIKVDPAKTVLIVQRGMARYSYACDPWCAPSAQIGDENQAFSEANGQVQAHNALAQGAQGTTQTVQK